MDKSSRDILDQAAKEYYRDLRRTKSTADESATHNRGHNRYCINNTITCLYCFYSLLLLFTQVF